MLDVFLNVKKHPLLETAIVFAYLTRFLKISPKEVLKLIFF